MNMRQRLLQILDLLDSSINGRLLQIGNAFVRLREMLIKLKLKLEEESQGSSSFFAHDLMDELGIKWHFKISECIFDLIEVMDFGIFV